jgi:hypothetical protein
MKKQYRVTFRKFFTAGHLKGLAVEETMRFPDWTHAVSWAGSVTRSPKTNYVVTDIHGPNGEKATF